MKIAILSLIPEHNYGGILQSYALQTVLERMGHDVEILKKDMPSAVLPFSKKILVYPARIIRKYILRKDVLINQEKYNVLKSQKENSLLIDFVHTHLHTRKIKHFREIKENEYDAYIVGSDQVWRPRYFKRQYQESMQNAFFSFTKDWNVIRIAYAPSFAVDVWEYSKKETLSCKEAIKRFNAISVREKSGIELCRKYLNTSSVCVLDPTLLLNASDYRKFIYTENRNAERRLVVYTLDSSPLLDKITKHLSFSLHIKPFNANDSSVEYINNEPVKQSVESWLKTFYDAEIIVTDSFHASVFSMIFNKPFIVVGNKARGMSRITDLLQPLGQQFRLVETFEQYQTREENLMQAPKVIDVLQKDRTYSMDFLKNNLK